jgi:hypothetical protein
LNNCVNSLCNRCRMLHDVQQDGWFDRSGKSCDEGTWGPDATQSEISSRHAETYQSEVDDREQIGQRHTWFAAYERSVLGNS